jgi:hypothetical protein
LYSADLFLSIKTYRCMYFHKTHRHTSQSNWRTTWWQNRKGQWLKPKCNNFMSPFSYNDVVGTFFRYIHIQQSYY